MIGRRRRGHLLEPSVQAQAASQAIDNANILEPGLMAPFHVDEARLAACLGITGHRGLYICQGEELEDTRDHNGFFHCL